MQDLLSILNSADYRFIQGLIESPFNLTDDTKIGSLLSAFEEDETDENRVALTTQLESSIRYLGSSDLAYAFRSFSGADPGVSFREMISDVSSVVKVSPPSLGTDREMVEQLATDYATKQFSDLTPEQQQAMLEDLGVERDKAAAFLKRSAGVFALPMLIEAFNFVIVQGLIKTIIFGTIAKIVGSQLAGRLFSFLVARMPWWISWIGPAAWTLSIGWTTIDLQGPARRKTVPVVLYLGLCSLRERHRDSTSETEES